MSGKQKRFVERLSGRFSTKCGNALQVSSITFALLEVYIVTRRTSREMKSSLIMNVVALLFKLNFVIALGPITDVLFHASVITDWLLQTGDIVGKKSSFAVVDGSLMVETKVSRDVRSSGTVEKLQKQRFERMLHETRLGTVWSFTCGHNRHLRNRHLRNRHLHNRYHHNRYEDGELEVRGFRTEASYYNTSMHYASPSKHHLKTVGLTKERICHSQGCR